MRSPEVCTAAGDGLPGKDRWGTPKVSHGPLGDGRGGGGGGGRREGGVGGKGRKE